MPAGMAARARSQIVGAYTAGRLKSLFDRRRRTAAERQAQEDAETERAIAELERRQRVSADLAEARANLAALHEAIRADPHDAYRGWLNRTHVSYDFGAMRAGKLQRSGRDSRMRADYSDVLDEDMNDLGEDERTFLRNVERVQKQRDELAAARRKLADETAAEKRRRAAFTGRIPQYLRTVYAT